MSASLIISVIILAIILFFPLLMTKIRTIPFISKQITIKVNFLLVGIYLALLIVLSLACLFLPRKALVRSISSPQLRDDISRTFDKKASQCDFSAPNGFIKTEKCFSADDSSVSIVMLNYDAYVVTKTKGKDAPDNHDGKIDVYCFTLKNPIFINLTQSPNAQTPTIEYSGSQISVKRKQNAFVAYGFDDTTSARQFFTHHENKWMNQISFVSQNVIVVLFPRGTRISGTSAGFSTE